MKGVDKNYWTVLDKFKKWLIDYRITPKSMLWPGGVVTSKGCPFINYDCDSNSWKDSDGIWGFEANAKKYIKGEGFNNGNGFPTLMVMHMKNNDPSSE